MHSQHLYRRHGVRLSRDSSVSGDTNQLITPLDISGRQVAIFCEQDTIFRQQVAARKKLSMPVTIHLPGVLREFADGRPSVEIADPVATLADVLAALWRDYPGIRARMATEQGQVREHINVFIGDELSRYTGGLMSPVAAGSEITILPAVSGG